MRHRKPSSDPLGLSILVLPLCMRRHVLFHPYAWRLGLGGFSGVSCAIHGRVVRVRNKVLRASPEGKVWLQLGGGGGWELMPWVGRVIRVCCRFVALRGPKVSWVGVSSDWKGHIMPK